MILNSYTVQKVFENESFLLLYCDETKFPPLFMSSDASREMLFICFPDFKIYGAISVVIGSLCCAEPPML